MVSQSSMLSSISSIDSSALFVKKSVKNSLNDGQNEIPSKEKKDLKKFSFDNKSKIFTRV